MFNHKLCGVVASAALLFAATGCESIVEDLNNDPNNFTEITLPLALNQAQLNMASIAGALPAHIGAMWADQLTGTDRQYITFDQYAIGNNNFNEIWEDLYQRGIVHSQISKDLASASSLNQLQGIALVTEAFYFGEAASMFGDVPYTEVNSIEESTDPMYESQEFVLRQAVALLDEAIPLLGSAQVSVLSGNIFSTDAQWSQIANGLKARYLLGLMDYEGAYDAATAADMTSPEQDLEIISTTTNFGENLWWQFEVEQRTTYLTIGDVDLGFSYFQQLLSDTTEVSRALSDDKTDDSARYDYFIDPRDGPESARYNVQDGWAAQTANLPILTSVEVQLIRAEAALLKGTSDQDTAVAALNVARNYWDTKLGGDNYQDLDADDYDDDDDLRRQILIEKYLSVIGLTAFYDVNRTDNLIGVPSEIGLPLGKRFLYPATEQSSNDNFPGLVPISEALPLYK